MLHDDSILKKGLKKGDKAVFGQLYQAFANGLVRYAALLTRDEEAAQEIVQDLFLDLWEKGPELEIRGSVKTYLFSSAYHRGLNWIRSRKIRETYAADPVSIWNWFAFPASPDHLDPLQMEIIEAQIRLLPAQCREVFSRSAIMGEKIPEIARALGISDKTAENHLARAKAILRKKLSKIR